ncbi:GDSL lipase/esterase [Dillenia turbinata]|uniref:GDSL lipase/esterase n=1 Tax=Dillenia turbinata TaxID=194707 RepID=A0AAN8W5L6_9MAGN
MDNKGGYGPLFLALFLFLCFSFFLSVDSQCDREPTIFVFGDSNSDTGGYEAGTGLITKPPNGMTFFHHPVGRFCDGRLNISKHGGQNFWVHNSGPLGCLPMKLAITSKNTSDLDQYGCLQSLNGGAKAFNEKLHLMCDQLRVELKNATIIYVDMFTIRYDLIANATKYGFENPLMACCGYGGQPYNTHPRITCGKPGYNRCEDPSKYISWDGVHYTEAANIITAEKILSTIYCTPSAKFNFFCKKSSG